MGGRRSRIRLPLVGLTIGLLLFASCRPTGRDDVGPDVIVDRNGEGALHYAPETGFGVDKTIVDVGVAWSAGSVTLCKKSATDHVILQRVDAVSVRGQVRLDGIGVRTTHYAEPGHSNPNTHLVGTMRGVPDGLQSPDGFRVVTTCPDSRAPVGEIVVTMTKTGAEGGSLDDLRLLYSANGVVHQLTLRFHFGLCGTGRRAVPCRS